MAFEGSDWSEGRMLRIVADEPVVASHEDALFVPGDRRGIFDRNGRLIVPATDFPSDGDPEGGAWSVDPADHAAAEDAADLPHVHAGPAPTGLPSFLVRTLPRLWSRVTSHGAAARLLFHGGEPTLDRAFADPHVLAALASLGIARADCVSYDRPVRIRSLIAPAPAFEPACGVAHAAHQRTLARLADALVGPDRGDDPDPRPLHLSTSSSSSGTADDRGRRAIDETLRRAGVRVIEADALPLAAIAAAVGRAAVVSAIAAPGSIGPLLAAFAPHGTPVLLLRPDGGASVSSAEMGAARLTAVLLGHRGGILDPATVSPAPNGAAGAAQALANAIAHADASRRSAVHAADWSVPGQGAPGAVLGCFLSGRARMRTGHAQRPWWEVDLGRITTVSAVRVHGPAEGSDRPDGLRILASADRRGWTVVAEHDRGAPVGNGLGGTPPWDAVLPPRTEARHLRIQLLTHGVLALDQVEIRTE